MKWTDADGVQHDMKAGSGSPHAVALQFGSPQMLPTELLFAFLDDVYVSNPGHTRVLFDLLGEKLAHVASSCMPGRRGCGTRLLSARPTSTIGETRGNLDSWHPGVSVGGGEPPLGGRGVGSRRPVCLADYPSMCGAHMSSLPQDSAPPGSRLSTRMAMMMACGERHASLVQPDVDLRHFGCSTAFPARVEACKWNVCVPTISQTI